MRVAQVTLAGLLSGLILAAAAAVPVAAQRAAERYIPIGQSPGVSGVSTEMGVVTRVNERTGVMTIDVDGRDSTYVMTAWSHVWLDRSDEGASNLEVSYQGLRVGDVVEVKRGDPVAQAAGVARPEGPPLVDWIKIADSERD